MEVSHNCKTLAQEEPVISKEAPVVADDDDVDDHDGPLPGFRFHPTDEELVSFYLKRKVENRRPLSIEIIKEIDIYKQDPWDLAKGSNCVGDKEWYFYCKRGRKYRNSIRPNRVTGSGFWKATGIDRPIYCNGGEGHQCIGLKKSLVYYRGSAGKGTKTDWMMHEFRLPSDIHHQHNFSNPKDTAQEAEIWTLCRIFKRNKRHTPDWRQLSSRKNAILNSSSKTSSIDSNTNQEHYISFVTNHQEAHNDSYKNSNLHYVSSDESKDIYNENHNTRLRDPKNLNIHHVQQQHQQQQLRVQQQQWNSMAYIPPYTSSRQNMLLNNHVLATEDNDFQSLAYYGWDDLSAVVDFAYKKPFL